MESKSFKPICLFCSTQPFATLVAAGGCERSDIDGKCTMTRRSVTPYAAFPPGSATEHAAARMAECVWMAREAGGRGTDWESELWGNEYNQLQADIGGSEEGANVTGELETKAMVLRLKEVEEDVMRRSRGMLLGLKQIRITCAGWPLANGFSWATLPYSAKTTIAIAAHRRHNLVLKGRKCSSCSAMGRRGVAWDDCAVVLVKGKVWGDACTCCLRLYKVCNVGKLDEVVRAAAQQTQSVKTEFAKTFGKRKLPPALDPKWETFKKMRTDLTAGRMLAYGRSTAPQHDSAAVLSPGSSAHGCGTSGPSPTTPVEFASGPAPAKEFAFATVPAGAFQFGQAPAKAPPQTRSVETSSLEGLTGDDKSVVVLDAAKAWESIRTTNMIDSERGSEASDSFSEKSEGEKRDGGDFDAAGAYESIRAIVMEDSEDPEDSEDSEDSDSFSEKSKGEKRDGGDSDAAVMYESIRAMVMEDSEDSDDE